MFVVLSIDKLWLRTLVLICIETLFPVYMLYCRTLLYHETSTYLSVNAIEQTGLSFIEIFLQVTKRTPLNLNKYIFVGE